jgi:hypothetical protein
LQLKLWCGSCENAPFRYPPAIAGETDETLKLYGINEDPTDGFGRQCLLARRFAEAGVRFIELGHGSWDQYSNIQTALADNCDETDKPIAGLLADLKRRDLLKDAFENKMHIHDWHATILHLLGLDHEQLTYHYGGREMRLTDVAGSVAADIVS